MTTIVDECHRLPSSAGFVNLRLFIAVNLTLQQVFFKENVRNPVWICRDPIFSDFRDAMIILSDSRDPI